MCDVLRKSGFFIFSQLRLLPLVYDYVERFGAKAA
jgi:hypothetical protein